MSFQPTPHPVLELPTAAQAAAMGGDRFVAAMNRREKIIAEEKADPFGHGWEPPIWRVCYALLGLPWVAGGEAWAERMRRRLGFDRPVDILLINGGQRGGKSQFAGKTGTRVIWSGEHRRMWASHSTIAMSRQYQQPVMHSYLPPSLRAKDIRTAKTYITFKQKTGFSEEQFVLPNGSDCVFKAYEQDVKHIEGGNVDYIWNDELVPPDWVETMELRIAERKGKMVITFTPVQGYTNTVQLFQDGAETVMDSIAYLCPRDGGPPDPARALGLSEAELAELFAAEKEGRAARCAQSRPEDCDAWLAADGAGKAGEPAGGSPAGTGGSPVPPRIFERVPRVMKCAGAEGKRAVVFFHSSDNPYGNPKEVWRTIANKSQAFIKERFYGLALKGMTARFPKFDARVHVIAPSAVPARGTNYFKVDPSSGRNFYMLWARVTPEGICFYREWPGNYHIPGLGVPGPWAVPDGKKKDGKPGPAQSPFGFGNLRYKLELARLEGWRDYERDRDTLAGGPDLSGDDRKIIAAWDETNGARERMASREMDARFASVPKNENDRPTTLLTDFEDILLFFNAAPAGSWADRMQKLTDALDYDGDRAVDFYNKPRLTVSSECPNLIYALRTYTGEDGQKGATKDPIETAGWFLEGDNPYLGDQGPEEETDTPAGSRVWSEDGELGRTPVEHY